MKNLIYMPLVLISMALFASCKKDSISQTPTPPPPPDTLVNLTLSNYSGGIYETALRGSAGSTYTFDLPATGKQIVKVKKGKYDITVYPTGDNYSSHTIALSTAGRVFAPRAQFNDVLINPTNDQLELSIN